MLMAISLGFEVESGSFGNPLSMGTLSSLDQLESGFETGLVTVMVEYGGGGSSSSWGVSGEFS